MKKQFLFSFSLAVLVSLFCSTNTFAQSPAAAPVKPASAPPAAAPAALVPTLPQSPTESPPTTPAADIIGILRNANGYSVFIRLLKTTQLINQLNSQLATTKSGGITILAPDDGAFSELKAGFLNTLSDRQKLELLQFHILPDYVTSSNFDTVTNPVRTLASSNPSKAQLNVTSFGGSVNISTGVVNTTLNGVIYMDKHLSMYKVGNVLLPQDFFAAKTKAVAPVAPVAAAPRVAPAIVTAKAPKPEKEKAPSSSVPSESSQSQVVPTNTKVSGTMRMSVYGTWVSLGVALVAVLTI